MSEPDSASTEDQLDAITSLSDVLEQNGLEFWLFGGWAVDFCVGAITRQHDDIDVMAWRGDYDAIKVALETAGWEHTPVADEVLGTRYRMRSAEVEFTFVTADDQGQVILPVPEHPVVVSEGPLGDERRELRGVATRTIPLALLRDGKSVPRAGMVEGAKDRTDYEALMRVDNTT